MLVLSRKTNESIVIGNGIVVTVNRISGNRVAIGIEAPDDMRIVRGELLDVVNSFSDEPSHVHHGMPHPPLTSAPTQLEMAAGSIS